MYVLSDDHRLRGGRLPIKPMALPSVAGPDYAQTPL